jgi:uncharacterized protein
MSDLWRTDMEWLKSRTILLTVGGSRAYGTNTETSDVDIKGVCIPPREYLLGFLKSFEQCVAPEHIQGFREYVPANLHGIIDATKLEGTVYDIRKFLRLAVDCNPNILEVLFCDDADVLKSTPAGRALRENRNLFLSKAARPRYRGYAMSQLSKIKNHRGWLLNPPLRAPTRTDFGLSERMPVAKNQMDSVNAMVQKRLDHWNDGGYIDDLDESVKIRVREGMSQFLQEIGVSIADREAAVMTSMGMDDNLIHLLQMEKAYANAVNQWTQYQSWLSNRNPDRAALEAKFGFDTKHGMHLARLLLTCREILRDCVLKVRRDDAEFLLGIRRGMWTFDQLVEWSESLQAEIDVINKTSKLPMVADRVRVDALCQKLILESLS